MRKFARSIGSEGKRHRQRGKQCPLSGGRLQLLYCGSLTLHSVCDRSVCVKATLLRLGNWSPDGTLGVACYAQRIANSELLTAGNPTV